MATFAKTLSAVLLLATWPLPVPAQSRQVEVQFQPQELIQQRLETVSRKLEERLATLRALFEESGCRDDRLTSQKVSGSRAPNVICTLPTEEPNAPTIVVGGHFDLITAGMGAIDDWSGVVLLPSLYRSLAVRARRHKFVFIGFAAEEDGMVGSKEYVHKLTQEQRGEIHAMINLECLGTSPPKVWATRADKRLLTAISRVARSLNLDLGSVNIDRVGDDDSHPFLNAGIPVLTIHSITQETFAYLHSRKDTLEAIHQDDYYGAYRLAALYLAYLDVSLD